MKKTLTISDLANIVSKIITETKQNDLNEVVGIPKNLLPVVEKILTSVENKLIQDIDGTNNQYMYEFRFKIPVKLGEKSGVNLEGVNVKVKLHSNKNNVFGVLGASNQGEGGLKVDKINQNGRKYKSYVERVLNNVATINLEFLVPQNFNETEFIKFFQKNKKRVENDLAHELHHFYERTLNRKTNVKKYLDYVTSNKMFDKTSYKVIRSMVYPIYLSSDIEVSVTSSEFANEIKKGLSNNEFLDLFKSSEVLNGYRINLKGWTAGGYLQLLKDNISEINKILEKINYGVIKENGKVIRTFLKDEYDILNRVYEKLKKSNPTINYTKHIDLNTSNVDGFDDVHKIILFLNFLFDFILTLSKDKLNDLVNTTHFNISISPGLDMSKKTEKLKDLSSASFNEIISITRNYKQNPMELLKKYEKHFHNQYDKVMRRIAKTYAYRPSLETPSSSSEFDLKDI
jgi:hypothetical protein